MTTRPDPMYAGYDFPVEVISYAVSIALPSGTYEVSLWSGEEEIIRRNEVSLAPGEQKTVYFTP